jgi:nicotinamidase-related amidase
MNVHLITIDPQVDFCDPTGSLFVNGADEDMKRLAKMITRLGKKINEIHVTLDSHRTIDIAHPIFWVNSKGEHPGAFTLISEDDVVNGKWTTTYPAWRQRGIDYVRTLKKNSRYLLCIWPPHCIIGSRGHSIYPSISDALIKWENDNFRIVDYITKGSNIFTEHYSAVKADVPDSSDPSTMTNTRLIDILQTADVILITGEALSHCVANTIRDIANDFSPENIKKFILLEDTTSNVGTFEQLGKDFVKEMVAKGMQVTKSTEFLK